MRSTLQIFVALGVTLLCACASMPVQQWYSEPTHQTIAGPGLRVTLEPLKENTEYFVGFRLTLHNDGQTPLTLDWNKTRYLHNAKDLGLFIFKGIDPAAIQGNIPPEVVPAGAVFTQEIFPLRTIAFLPRDQIPQEGRRGFIPGILPAGENGILLSLSRDGQASSQKLSLRLRAETEPKK